jgi:hypothetical protein
MNDFPKHPDQPPRSFTVPGTIAFIHFYTPANLACALLRKPPLPTPGKPAGGTNPIARVLLRDLPGKSSVAS